MRLLERPLLATVGCHGEETSRSVKISFPGNWYGFPPRNYTFSARAALSPTQVLRAKKNWNKKKEEKAGVSRAAQVEMYRTAFLESRSSKKPPLSN